MQKKILLVAVAMAVLMSAVVYMPASDAGQVQDDTYYCYGDHPIMQPISEDVESDWTVTDEAGNDLTDVIGTPNEDGTLTVDLTGRSTVIVTQVVGDQTARATLKALHLGDGKIVVNFYDRGSIIHDVEIDGFDVIKANTNFVTMPADPSRDGYEFSGWYTDAEGYEDGVFEPTVPITEDINVYATWTSVAGTGSVQMGQYIITFDCSPGLTYTLLDSGNGRVSFTISELPDYQVMEGSIEVEANGNPVSPVDGVYTVTGINTDVLITIDGDLMFSGNPNDPASDDGGMPMWMWIMLVVVILLIAAAILWMRGRQVDQGRI